MRVLLISPNKIEPGTHPSLGLGYLSSYLRKQGHVTRIVEIASLVEKSFFDIVNDFMPDVVGISVWCRGYTESVQCAKYFRERDPNTTIVAGGPLGSFIQKELLESSYFDYVISGPGEIAMSKLLEKLSKKVKSPGYDISGVSFLEHTDNRGFGEQIGNINELPFPDRDPDSKFIFNNVLMATRGCNGHCIFCVARMMTSIKQRTVNNVLSEIEYLMECTNTNDFIFDDDNFAIDTDYTSRLCRAIESRYDLLWGCLVRAEIDHSLLEVMRSAGCVSITIGVESGNDDVLRKLSKGIVLQQIEVATAKARSLGMEVLLCYILGHYCDTVSTMDETLNHAVKMTKEYGAVTRFSCNTPFPGSPQYINADKLGLIINAKSWDDYNLKSPIVSAKGFTLHELREKYWESVNISEAGMKQNHT